MLPPLELLALRFEYLVRLSAEFSLLAIGVLAIRWGIRHQLSRKDRHRMAWIVLLGLTLASLVAIGTPSIAETQPPSAFSGTLGVIWLAGVLALVIRTVAAILRLHGQVARREPVREPELLALLEDSKRTMGVTAPVRLVITSLVPGPALMGLFRPVLLLPRYRMSRLAHRELRLIFLHELAHLRRHDPCFRLLLDLVQALHWFNPIFHLAIRQIRDEQELECDAQVLERAGADASRDYGRMLLDLAHANGRCAPAPSLLAMLTPTQSIRRRITMITQFEHRMWKYSACAVALLGSLSVFPAALATEPAAPTAAESSSKSTETRMFSVRSMSMATLLTKTDAKKVLEEFGITFPAGTGAVYRDSAGLLIVTHSSSVLDQIEEILLRIDPTVRRTGSDECRETLLRLDSIKLPAVQFEETPLKQAVGWLNEEARRLDPEGKGVNLLLKPTGLDPSKYTVTLNLRNITLKQAIKYLTQVTGLRYRLDESAVLIFAKE